VKATEANTIINAGRDTSLNAKTIEVEEALTDGEEDDDDVDDADERSIIPDEKTVSSHQTVVILTDDDGEREFEC
jgi:hypothetical protein